MLIGEGSASPYLGLRKSFCARIGKHLYRSFTLAREPCSSIKPISASIDSIWTRASAGERIRCLNTPSSANDFSLRTDHPPVTMPDRRAAIEIYGAIALTIGKCAAAAYQIKPLCGCSLFDLDQLRHGQ